MENYKLWIKKAKDDLNWTKHNIESEFTENQAKEAFESARKIIEFIEKKLK